MSRGFELILAGFLRRNDIASGRYQSTHSEFRKRLPLMVYSLYLAFVACCFTVIISGHQDMLDLNDVCVYFFFRE